ATTKHSSQYPTGKSAPSSSRYIGSSSSFSSNRHQNNYDDDYYPKRTDPFRFFAAIILRSFILSCSRLYDRFYPEINSPVIIPFFETRFNDILDDTFRSNIRHRTF